MASQRAQRGLWSKTGRSRVATVATSRESRVFLFLPSSHSHSYDTMQTSALETRLQRLWTEGGIGPVNLSALLSLTMTMSSSFSQRLLILPRLQALVLYSEAIDADMVPMLLSVSLTVTTLN